MTPTPELTIRKLLKRAATATADDLPKFIDAINNLHKLVVSPRDTALEQRVTRLEEQVNTPFGSPNVQQARFR